MKPSEALATHGAELRELVSRYDVKHPRIFGSVLTGTDDEESDLDMLVDATAMTSLFTLGGQQEEAQKLLGVPVQVLTPGTWRDNSGSACLTRPSPYKLPPAFKRRTGSPGLDRLGPALKCARGFPTRGYC